MAVPALIPHVFLVVLAAPSKGLCKPAWRTHAPQGRRPLPPPPRVAFPADAGQRALPGRVPAQERAHFPRPTRVLLCLGPAQPRSFLAETPAGRSGEPEQRRRVRHLTIGPQSPRREPVSGGGQGSRSSHWETHGPVRARGPGPPPFRLSRTLTRGSQNVSSRIEPPAPDPGVPGGPRAPRASSARPAPGEEPAGSWPLGRSGSRRVPPGVPALPPHLLAPAPSTPRALPAAFTGPPVSLSSRAGGARTLGGSGCGTGECLPPAGSEALPEPERAREAGRLP